jgi:F0F1-type ATP synthase assembly protein I
MNLHELSSLGIEFAIIIVGAVFLGNYLDNKFSTSPIYILVFSLLGFAYALYHLIIRTKKFQDKDKLK